MCLYLFLLVAIVDILYKYCTFPNVFSEKHVHKCSLDIQLLNITLFYNLNLLVDVFIHPLQLYYIMINDNLVI